MDRISKSKRALRDKCPWRLFCHCSTFIRLFTKFYLKLLVVTFSYTFTLYQNNLLPLIYTQSRTWTLLLFFSKAGWRIYQNCLLIVFPIGNHLSLLYYYSSVAGWRDHEPLGSGLGLRFWPCFRLRHSPIFLLSLSQSVS